MGGGGGGAPGGVVEGGSTSKKRPSHHKYVSKTVSVNHILSRLRRLVSRKALELNARWAFSVYPVFENEKSNRSDEKSVKRKIA